MVVKVIKVFPISRREYTDRQNQQQVFKSKGYVLHDGVSSFFAEAIQETAESVEVLGVLEGDVVAIGIRCVARTYTTKESEVRYSNEITLTHMMKL